MDVFILQHVHTFDDDTEDVKFIGVYSSQTPAMAAIERLRRQPGFCDTPEGFSIDHCTMDVDYWTEGFVTIEPNDR